MTSTVLGRIDADSLAHLFRGGDDMTGPEDENNTTAGTEGDDPE